MADIKKYDDVGWHFGAKGFPAGATEEYAGAHIGIFLRWCFARGWVGEIHRLDPVSQADVHSVVSGEMTGSEFLFKHCDGKLTSEDLSAAGNRFASKKYDRYLEKFGDEIGDNPYLYPEHSLNYPVFAEVIEKQFRSSIFPTGLIAAFMLLFFGSAIAGVVLGWALSEGSHWFVRILSAIGGELLANVLSLSILLPAIRAIRKRQYKPKINIADVRDENERIANEKARGSKLKETGERR